MLHRNSELPAIQVLESTEAAAVVLTPLRIQLLSLLSEPASATKLAKKLAKSRQIVNYHLRELEKFGLVVHIEDRIRGNVTERIMQRSADSYLIGPDSLGAMGALPERTPDKLSAAYLIAMAAKLIRELGKVLVLARKQQKQVATLTLHSTIRFASPEDRGACLKELSSEFIRIAAKYNDASANEGRDFELLLGMWPSLKEQN